MSWIISYRASDFANLPVGGKARALGALSLAGSPIPEWRVILPGTFDVSLTLTQKSELSRVSNAAEVAVLLKDISPNQEWLNGELPKLKALLGDALLAVRSSALDEDGHEHSFAGQLESYLNVTWEELPQRIADVWRSGFSERIFTYRRQAKLSLPPPAPAIIIQAMVPADAAGVAFSVDPVTGRRGIAVVAAVHGLGDRLVSGDANSDTYHIDRQDRLISHHLSNESYGNASLTEEQAIKVAQLARLCEAHFGTPQDIEWAIQDDRLFLLQSRPITSLKNLPDPDAAFNLWDNSNISESYSGVTTPLTFSFARQNYEGVYRQFVAILGVPQRRIDANQTTFSRMLGLLQGRVYYNLLSWYRVLSMLPGFSINRKFMEQMMGVKEPLPDDVLAEFKTPPAGWHDYIELIGTICGLIRNHWLLPEKIRNFYQRLDAVLNAKELPLSSMRTDELTHSFRTIQGQLLTHWDAPLVNDFFAMIYYGILRSLCDRWCGDRNATLQNDLVSGQGGIISAEPALRIQEMARLAAGHTELIQILHEGSLYDIQQTLPSHPRFQVLVQSYLDKFGERCLEELKLESATLHDDPLMLFRSIGRLATRPELLAYSKATSPTLRAQAEAKAAQALQKHPIRRLIFRFVLKRARARVKDRENLRFERTRVFGCARRIFVEIGKRFHADGVLKEPRDIFFLTVEEILGFVEGTAVTTDLRGLVALRQNEFETYRTTSPVDRFITRGTVYVANTCSVPITMKTAATEGTTLKGIGCCPGIVRGRVRVILDPRQAQMEVGEILVAPRTDPGWIMLFPSAAGLLVEYGSLLSHSAIVAREMGIPAIVSVKGLTSWLASGDEVEMDGSTGLITLINKASEEKSTHVC
ncbi:MAG: hypothetical protein B9S32_09645 [Verrucomicrobia bacterium Tous-C9LFEB]|nr:MAG: hypothetical protein B9S32_09645 [Verrucomicrobia bacterium Tous-C9LFEB]